MSAVLGDYPTPVFRASGLNFRRGDLWIKNDGLTDPTYGGNKVRKLGVILDTAVRQGAKRIVTAGGAGSHHVLATTIFARRRGLATAAVLCPQPHTDHAEQTLRASVAWGVEAIPVGSMAAVPFAILDNWQSGDFVVPVGGWGVAPSLGYAEAIKELADQMERGELPEPDVIVVALGSGGTAAGLLAGLAHSGLSSRLVATTVAVRSPRLARWLVVPLASQVAKRLGRPVSREALSARLLVDNSQLGRGYGSPTEATREATLTAEIPGIQLDPTYTAKAFATALELVGHREGKDRTVGTWIEECRGNAAKERPLRVLYWHTLAATPLGPLLADGPAASALSGQLRMLLQGG